MPAPDLADTYRRYIACLNAQDWPSLHLYVHPDAMHNGQRFGLAGYRAMLENDFATIPDLHFNIGLLIADVSHIASRLDFTCSPQGDFLGLPVHGKLVAFSENVFYRFQDQKIIEVWSIIDQAAIEAQLPR